MTLNDLLKRVSKDDYDKVIVISKDGIGWNNIEGRIKIDESTITLFESNLDRFALK
jgi:hypothetical protein